MARLVASGATVRGAVHDVGDGIRVATVIDPAGSIVGIIENPHFEATPAAAGDGPGR